MRCHINCCSWKNRPPFSASARHLCAPSGIPPLLRSFSLSGDSPTLVYRSLGVQGAPSIHSVRVRLPGWVTMATHSLRLCHVNSSPSFFPIPLSHKKKKRKVLNYSRKHSLQKNDWTGTQVKRLPVVFSFSFPCDRPLLPFPWLLLSLFLQRSGEISRREREEKKNSFKRAWADSAGELWHRLSLCICVYVCVSGAVWVLR